MAVKNYGGHVTGVYALPVSLGTVNANGTRVFATRLPWDHELLGVRTFAFSSTGTTPTLVVDVLDAGVTMLSAPASVVANTYTDGVVADSHIPAESELSLNVTVGGGTPSFVGVQVMIYLRKK